MCSVVAACLIFVALACFLKVFGSCTEDYTVQLPGTIATMDSQVRVFA